MNVDHEMRPSAKALREHRFVMWDQQTPPPPLDPAVVVENGALPQEGDKAGKKEDASQKFKEWQGEKPSEKLPATATKSEENGTQPPDCPGRANDAMPSE